MLSSDASERIYYSAQLVLMGAEFTRVYARRYGWRRSKSSSDAHAREPNLKTQGAR